jgi:hypothetical protein
MDHFSSVLKLCYKEMRKDMNVPIIEANHEKHSTLYGSRDRNAWKFRYTLNNFVGEVAEAEGT